MRSIGLAFPKIENHLYSFASATSTFLDSRHQWFLMTLTAGSNLTNWTSSTTMSIMAPFSRSHNGPTCSS